MDQCVIKYYLMIDNEILKILIKERETDKINIEKNNVKFV